MKKWYQQVLAFIVLTIFLVACGNESAKENNSSVEGTAPIRAAIDTAAGGSFQIRAANTEGYFKEHGIEVSLSNFAYGIDTVNAMLTEQADTGLAADYALLNSLNKGDFVVVSSLTGSAENVNVLDFTEVLASQEVKEANDLAGKKIGVAKGTVGEYHWSRYLEHLNISEDDVKFVPYSTPDEAIVGVKKGDIDAVLASGALLEKFKSIEGVHTLDKLSTVEGLNIASYLVVDRQFAEQNEVLIAQFISGIREGIEYVKSNPDGTADIAYKELKITKEDVHRDLERQNFTLGFTEQDYRHLETMKQYLLDKGMLKEDYDLKSKLFLAPAKEVIPKQVTYNE
ncbi:ABC transporter substrate-binding protein [Lysinibacillus sp. NPDC096418]|uniref:ABC transporter substrate-binding protein n=1 Tax=Lysinibacillus sp. NPDC096418 TaxID=3364138 RepID=UPI0037FD5079